MSDGNSSDKPTTHPTAEQVRAMTGQEHRCIPPPTEADRAIGHERDYAEIVKWGGEDSAEAALIRLLAAERAEVARLKVEKTAIIRDAKERVAGLSERLAQVEKMRQSCYDLHTERDRQLAACVGALEELRREGYCLAWGNRKHEMDAAMDKSARVLAEVRAAKEKT